MYHYYGIIDRSSHRPVDDQYNSIVTIRKKFPVRSASFKLIERGVLTLFGTEASSARIRNIELFLIGEIFNETEFRSGNDSSSLEKILLEQFLSNGETAFQKLNGSFIIITLEHDSGRCRIFNDQMGALQLFYYAELDFILFASELKFLFCHPRCPRQVDWTNSLKRHIPFLIINAERNYNAWFKNIELLEEGSVLDILPDGRTGTHPYWNPWQANSNSSNGIDHGSIDRQIAFYHEAYMELLDDAVKKRISSPGSAYSMFSGGLDSSVLASLAKKYSDVGTFSFATQATVRDGATEMCIRLADDLGMTNAQVLVPFEELTNDGQLWAKHIWSMESPMAHKDAIGKMALHAAINMIDPSVRHILSGSGSDQLNGGLVRWFVEGAEEDAHDVNWKRAINEMQTEMLKPVIGHQYDTFWGSRDLLRHDYLASLNSNPLDEYPWNKFVHGCLHANQFILIWDELRAAHWHQRGVRFPFMDYRFVPFVLNVPKHLHEHLFFDKQILRNGAKSILPGYLTNRPKAPVVKPGEDRRINMYKEILFGNNEAILGRILDSLNGNDLPVDRQLFESKARQLADVPDPAGWAYLMHVAGLVMLNQLPDQDEITMDMPGHMMAQIEMVRSTDAGVMKTIRKKLSVLPLEEIMQLPLSFAPGCSLVSDVFTNVHFLVKDGEMCYQLDDGQPEWFMFLRSIDQVRSAYKICAEEGIDLARIHEFLQTSLEEGILYNINTKFHAAI
jgi:asparagine synthetase B (glutamine-hydrolysing)